ncbi:MAG: hypothetical protein ACTHN5_22065 [Phycisphaerae bacterium]
MSNPPSKKKNLAYAALALAIVILSAVVYRLQTAGTTPPPLPPTYYSADDGQTWFPSTKFQFAPFLQDGKEVTSANLFVGSDGKPFVGFLFKYTPEGQAMLSGFKSDSMAARQSAAQYALVKRPGDKDWVPADSSRGRQIIEKVLDPKTHQPAQPYNPT